MIKNTNWFPSTYEESRDRFRSWSQRFAPDSFLVPSERAQDLTVDTLYSPSARPEKLFVLTSGVHGPESFVGSAIQNLFCEKYIGSYMNKNMAVLLVHGINPFGFRFNRRVTENNINLNRNFDVDDKLFTSSNDGYRLLKPLLEPLEPVTSLPWESFKRSCHLLGLLILKRVKAQSVIQAIGQGQYDSPRGLEFGGRTFEPQVTFLAQLFKRLAEPYTEILHIDLHTGLGRKKALQILTGETPLTDASHNTLKRIFSQSFASKTFDFADGNTHGFYHTHGDIVSLLPKIWGERKRCVLGLTAEFGTLGNSIFSKLRSLNYLVLENQGFHNGYKTDILKNKADENFKNFFFPSSSSWRSNALAKADLLFKTILEKY